MNAVLSAGLGITLIVAFIVVNYFEKKLGLKCIGGDF